MVMVMDLLRVVRHLYPRYLAGSVREAKCTHLGYGTRLSKLHTLDPLISVSFYEGQPFSNTRPQAGKYPRDPR
jgi:hypothetical protein